MADPNLKVGPQNPDSTAELTQRVGVANNALHLLRRHARNMPAELAADIARPRDERRSLVAEDNLEYVAKIVGFPDDVEVVGASVRGSLDSRDADRIVIVQYILPSKRSAKGSVEWEKFPQLATLYEQRERARLGLVARAAAQDPEQADELPLTAEDADELRKRVEAAEQAALEADEQLQRTAQDTAAVKAAIEEARTLRERVEELTKQIELPPEPFEGAAEASIPDIEQRIEETPEGLERELLKRDVREFEQAVHGEKARKGVLEATEPVELVPATA